MPAAALTVLSPWAALIAVPACGAVVAAALGRRRAQAVRQVLRLPPPDPDRSVLRLALLAVVVALLAISAAQPAVAHDRHVSIRRDAQALFVFDISRSMAASARLRAPTRLDRAVAAAVRLRAGVPGISAGVATLTDRVLPNLLPVADTTAFDRVVERGLSIESPPPRASAVRATSYNALEGIPGAGYFDPQAKSRIVVVLTDGESAPVQTAEIEAAFAAHPGYHVLFVRFWRSNEAVYDADGHAEANYHPDPAAAAALEALAGAIHGSVYDEGSLAAAGSRLRSLAGSGPAFASAGVVRTTSPLAPFTAAAALVAALALIGLPAWRTRTMIAS
jgi:hypothetical protein